MNARARALLRDVARAIVESGYAEYPRRPRTRLADRSQHIAEIAQDNRIHSRAKHTRRALIEDVIQRYGVTYRNAKILIHRARVLLLDKRKN